MICNAYINKLLIIKKIFALSLSNRGKNKFLKIYSKKTHIEMKSQTGSFIVMMNLVISDKD